jgi:hypothetical protein
MVALLGINDFNSILHVLKDVYFLSLNMTFTNNVHIGI